jgi:hypothetical protein
MNTMWNAADELDAIVAVAEADASIRLYQLLAADVPREQTIEALLQVIARRGWLVAEMTE